MKMGEEQAIAMLQQLSDANGVSGFEDEAVALLRGFAHDLGDVREDRMRNLYVRREGNAGDRPVALLDAHSDEVGFMVQAVNKDGTLKILPLGAWTPACVPAHPVRVRVSSGAYIPGITASKPPHYLSDAEKAAAPKLEDMAVDIGATSREEAVERFGVRIGEPVVPDVAFRYLPDAGLLYGKAFDCRVGCAAVVATLVELAGRELDVDVTVSFSTQEEVGLRGARVTANTAKPDVAIVFEGCPADDTFGAPDMAQTAIGKGPMLRHIDRSMITHPRFQRYALDLAAERGIPVQQAVRTGGGTNGGSIHLSNEGVPCIVVGLPVRYTHTHFCFMKYCDFESAVALSAAILESLNADVIAGF